MDTWALGNGDSSRWYDWENNGGDWEKISVEEIFDSQGNEWWPYWDGSDWGGGFYEGFYEWHVGGLVTLELVPEPATFLLFAFGAIFLRNRKNR